MSRRWVLLLIAVGLAGLGVLVFRYPLVMVAPGPLVAAHANLSGDCFACHAPLRGAVAERCVTCHKLADIGRRTTIGAAIIRQPAATPFHAGLTSSDCLACHTDHASPALSPRGRPFSHALLSPTVQQQCATCHTAPATLMHRGVVANCTQCHSQTRWKPAAFDHAKFFVLDGDHNAPCATCHTTPDAKQYTCYGCHEHTEANIRAKHVRKRIADYTNCVACHRSAHGEHGKDGRKDGHKGGGKDDD